MMNEQYKRENHKSYLVLKLEDLSQEADYGMKMLCENPLDNFLSMSVHVFNGEKELCYDISSKQTFQILYEKRMLYKEDLEKLFSDLEKALKQLDEYLLEPECLVLEPSYIYVRGCDSGLSFLYAPFRNDDFEEMVYDFAEYILEKICNEDEDAVMYAYSFYRYVKEEKGDLSVALEKVTETLKVSKDITEATSYTEVEEVEPSVNSYGTLQEDTQTDEEQKSYVKVMRTSFFAVLGLSGLGMMIYSVWKYALSFSTLFSQAESVVGAGICAVAIGGLVLFYVLERYSDCHEASDADILFSQSPLDFRGEIGQQDKDILYDEEPDRGSCSDVETVEDFATVLLQENCYKEQRILTGRVKGRKRQIDLSSFPFVVGKNKEQVDYALEDASVSRVHARFTLRDDVIYLTDLNSTNGTKRNGVLLEPNEMVMLEADDEITFGRLTFTYH